MVVEPVHPFTGGELDGRDALAMALAAQGVPCRNLGPLALSAEAEGRPDHRGLLRRAADDRAERRGRGGASEGDASDPDRSSGLGDLADVALDRGKGAAEAVGRGHPAALSRAARRRMCCRCSSPKVILAGDARSTGRRKTYTMHFHRATPCCYWVCPSARARLKASSVRGRWRTAFEFGNVSKDQISQAALGSSNE